MRCVRAGRWSGAYLPPRNPRTTCLFSRFSAPEERQQVPYQASSRWQQKPFHSTCLSRQAATSRAHASQEKDIQSASESPQQRSTRLARIARLDDRLSSPPTSAKLAALHARLSLPARFTLSTLKRCLIHPSAYPGTEFNNASLAILGQELIAHYTAEWLLCNYPRLPMPVLYAAQYAYSGDKTLAQMMREWGVEAASSPGEEVDPGYLQFQRISAGNAMAPDMLHRMKDVREAEVPSGTGRPREEFHHRRGMSSRIVYDDEFGDLRSGVAGHDNALGLDADVAGDLAAAEKTAISQGGVTHESASASFIRAVFGALYIYNGAQSMQSFHRAHILSRHLPLHSLFRFKNPTADLARLCDREGFEPPVARLISETGRKTRTPVFVVGVYSGKDKLGEDAGASLNEGRTRAAAQALRSWYLYSPPADEICLPSEQGELEKKGKKWKPQFIDSGEIVT